MVQVAESFAEHSQLIAHGGEAFTRIASWFKGSYAIQQIAHLLLDVPILGDFTKGLRIGDDTCLPIANRHDARLAQLHPAIRPLRPTIAYPHRVLPGQAVRFVLLETLESAE